jgi:hypothetical protein
MGTVLLPRPVLKLFKDNTPLGEGADAKGILELRVSDADVKSVEFVSVQKEGTRTSLGKGTFDDFLSNDDYTTWAYFWNTASTSGEYKVSGVVTHGSGVITETLPVSISLIGTIPLTLYGAMPAKTDSTNTPSLLGIFTPDQCVTEAECRAFCGSTKERYVACKIYVRAPIDAGGMNGTFFIERIGARLFIDSDGDDIRDYDEVNLYGTNPESKDTDKDGFPDDRELLGATNPRGGTTTGEALINLNSDIAQSADSLESIIPVTSSLALLHVGMTKEDGASSSSPVEIIARGRALPHSFVTLFIFSRPFTAVVPTDKEGNFTYTLPRELADGTHHIYATISAMNGTPLLRSDAYVFVKSGNHVGRTHALPVSAAYDVDMQIALFDSSFLASLFLFAGLFLFVCAFWWRNRSVQSGATVPHSHQKPFGHVVYLK